MSSARETFEATYKFLEHMPRCLPKLPCVRQTPYGEVEGLKCELTDEVNHNTTISGAVKIAESGYLKSGAYKGGLGQDAISLSSCPAQDYGGNVKMIFDSGKILDKLRAMCYVDFSSVYDEEGQRRPGPYDHVERGMGKEATEEIDGPRGSNRVRAKYAVQLDMYRDECEYLTYEDIPLRGNLKRIEYWIPWKNFRGDSYSHGCDRGRPRYANVHNDLVDYLGQAIEKAKNAAAIAGVDFDVKSCFTALKTGWGETYVPLTEDNLKKMKEISAAHFREELSKMVEKDVPQECRC